MVLQVPVSTGQLLSCARARAAGTGEVAFGHAQAKLQMGIVKYYEDGEEKQKFSVDAAKTVPYEPTTRWVGSSSDPGKLTSEESSGSFVLME